MINEYVALPSRKHSMVHRQMVHKISVLYNSVSQVLSIDIFDNVSIFYPNFRDVEELMLIIAQAKDNGSTMKVVGESFHSNYNKDDIIVSVVNLNKLLGLNTNKKSGLGSVIILKNKKIDKDSAYFSDC